MKKREKEKLLKTMEISYPGYPEKNLTRKKQNEEAATGTMMRKMREERRMKVARATIEKEAEGEDEHVQW